MGSWVLFSAQFINAMTNGQMFLMDFVKVDNVFDSGALEKPFDWDLRKNLKLFCYANYQSYVKWREENYIEKDVVRLRCPSCSVHYRYIGPSITLPSQKTAHFLFRPSARVKRYIDSVMSQVSPEQQLVGVHFRTEWFGEHFHCGCMTPSDIGKCASNYGNYSAELAMLGFNRIDNSAPVKFFVASDSQAGIDAFEQAFGPDRVLHLPDDLRIQHALACSADGGDRIIADFMILTMADAVIGSCGSTFSHMVEVYRGQQQLKTDSPEFSSCVAGAKDLDYSGFAWNKISKINKFEVCNCYGPKDFKQGTCSFQCMTDEYVPSRCRSKGYVETRSLLRLKRHWKKHQFSYSSFWHTYLPTSVLPGSRRAMMEPWSSPNL